MDSEPSHLDGGKGTDVRVGEGINGAVDGEESRRIGMSQYQASGFRRSSSVYKYSRDRKSGGLAVA